MWADDSDDERPGFGGGSGKSSKQYSAPIGFVSGGVKVGDKVTKEEEPVSVFTLNEPKFSMKRFSAFGQISWQNMMRENLIVSNAE